MDEQLNTTRARIRRRRKELGLSQERLAWLTGMSHSNVSRMEREKHNLAPATLRKVATALGVSVAYLLVRTDDPSPRAIVQQPEDPPVYGTWEADEAAQLIDLMPEKWRTVALDTVRSVAVQAAIESEELQSRPTSPEAS